MTLTQELAAEVEAFAVPDLAVEFTDTLCRTWAQERDEIRAGRGDPALMFKLLDSLTSVVLEDFVP